MFVPASVAEPTIPSLEVLTDGLGESCVKIRVNKQAGKADAPCHCSSGGMEMVVVEGEGGYSHGSQAARGSTGDKERVEFIILAYAIHDLKKILLLQNVSWNKMFQELINRVTNGEKS